MSISPEIRTCRKCDEAKEIGEFYRNTTTGYVRLQCKKCICRQEKAKYQRSHPPQSVEERFWAKVAATGDCWVWTGSTRQRGYGCFTEDRKPSMAHRWAYEYLVGPIPPALTLDHLCRNRACVNPAHLEPVTLRENILRGVGVTAVNAKKTHCKRGHPLFGENLKRVKLGRCCRECANEHSRRYKARKREACAN